MVILFIFTCLVVQYCASFEIIEPFLGQLYNPNEFIKIKWICTDNDNCGNQFPVDIFIVNQATQKLITPYIRHTNIRSFNTIYYTSKTLANGSYYIRICYSDEPATCYNGFVFRSYFDPDDGGWFIPVISTAVPIIVIGLLCVLISIYIRKKRRLRLLQEMSYNIPQPRGQEYQPVNNIDQSHSYQPPTIKKEPMFYNQSTPFQCNQCKGSIEPNSTRCTFCGAVFAQPYPSPQAQPSAPYFYDYNPPTAPPYMAPQPNFVEGEPDDNTLPAYY